MWLEIHCQSGGTHYMVRNSRGTSACSNTGAALSLYDNASRSAIYCSKHIYYKAAVASCLFALCSEMTEQRPCIHIASPA